MLDGVPDIPGLVAVSFYETKPAHFLSMCCNSIKWVQKIRQVYDPEKKMVCDTHFLRLNSNYSYDYNMKSFDLSDQLRNMYRVDH